MESFAPIQLPTYLLEGVGLICLLAKFSGLVWAYGRTSSPAAIAYLICLLAQVVVPALMARQLGVSEFTAYWPSYQLLIFVVEAGLFLWLVRSLLEQHSEQLPKFDSDFSDSDF